MSRPALTVWCLSDGKPGHFNQSKGLLQALALGYEVNLHWIDCSLQAKPLRPLLRKLLNAGIGQRLLPALHRFNRPAETPDLIISAGGNTAYLNIALAQQYGCQNLFIGSLRGLKPSLFTTVLTIEPIGADNNLVMPLAPVPSDRDAQAEAARQLRAEQQLEDTQPLWTLLIGGATDEYAYQAEDWKALAGELNRLARQHNIRWLITSSRRTGIEVEQQLAAALAPELLADTTWYGQQPRKVMAAYLGAAEAVFCTEDSLSMLTEAIASGKPVVALQPAQMQPAARYEAALERLEQRQWLSRQPVTQLALPPATDHSIPAPAEALWQQLQTDSPLRPEQA